MHVEARQSIYLRGSQKVVFCARRSWLWDDRGTLTWRNPPTMMRCPNVQRAGRRTPEGSRSEAAKAKTKARATAVLCDAMGVCLLTRGLSAR